MLITKRKERKRRETGNSQTTCLRAGKGQLNPAGASGGKQRAVFGPGIIVKSWGGWGVVVCVPRLLSEIFVRHTNKT